MTVSTSHHYDETRDPRSILSGSFAASVRTTTRKIPKTGRALQAFLDESADLLRMIREAVNADERHRAARRLYWMAIVVGAPELTSAISDFRAAAFDDELTEHEIELQLASLARVHAAAAEARAAAAALVDGEAH